MVSFIKIILKFLGFELIRHNPNVYRINSLDFIPIKNNEKDWQINIKAFKKTKNIHDDFF
jgi:hypothetical protein